MAKLTLEQANKKCAAYTSGGLDLRGLTSAAGLTLPTTFSGRLDLSGLTSAAKQDIRQKGYDVY